MASRKEGRHADALKAFEGAHALMGLPTTGIEVALEQEAMGLLVEALATARAVAGMPAKTPEDGRALADATALVARVQPKVGTIEIMVRGLARGTPLRVRIDGVEVAANSVALPISANPGKHTLMIGAPGYRPVVRSVDVAESRSARLAVVLRTLPPAVPEDPPEAPPAGVQVHIDSNDPEVGLYNTYYEEGGSVTMPGKWVGNQYTPGMTMPSVRVVKHLVCLAPCDTLVRGDSAWFVLGHGRTELSEIFLLGNRGSLILRAEIKHKPSFLQRVTGLTLLTLGATSLVLGGFFTAFASLATNRVSWGGVGMMLGGGAGVGLGVGLYVNGLGAYRVEVPGLPQTGSPTMFRLDGVF